MNRSITIGVTLLVLLVFVFCCTSTTHRIPVHSSERGDDRGETPLIEKMSAEVSGHRVTLEVADSPDLRGAGLSGRRSLPENTGMVFIYATEDSRSYWMKDCLMGLDIAFLDRHARILNIVSADAPHPSQTSGFETVQSHGAAQFVVEMEKGWFAVRSISKGAVFNWSEALARRVRLIEELGNESP